MSLCNTGRVDAARFALASLQWAKGEAIEEDETAVIDMLTDLRHYCDAAGLCFGDLDHLAYIHYAAEREV